MAKIGKWIGGAIGWALGGPIGGILGYTLGSMFSSESGDRGKPGSRTTNSGDFAMALIVLSAAVMKADKKVLKSELNYVKQFLRNNFGSAQSDQLLILLKEALKQDVDVRQVASQIRVHMDHPKRLLLLQYLFGIAKSDGNIDPRETEIIRLISNNLGISEKDRQSIEELFHAGGPDPYKVLEINKTVTDSEIKRAYRRLAIKFHPDKVGDLGEGPKKQAKERFLQVQAAYENIKKVRGIK